MMIRNLFEQGIFGILVLALGAPGLRAQEPPPPPPEGGGDVVFFSRMEEASSANNIKGAPYSAQAITETNQTLSDGNQIHRTITATVYRDSEGRTRREQALGGFGPWSVADEKPRQTIWINDPAAGVTFVLNPDEHTAKKLPALRGGRRLFIERGAGPGMPPPPPDGEKTFSFKVPPPSGSEEGTVYFERGAGADEKNVQKESLGSQVIEGVQADGTRTTVTIPAGRIGNVKPIQIVTERWYSTQLQTVVMSKRSDPRVGETVYRLTNINQAEPATTLFQVPSDYKVEEGPRMRRLMRRDANQNPNQ